MPEQEWRQSLCSAVLRIFRGAIPSTGCASYHSYITAKPFPIDRDHTRLHLNNYNPVSLTFHETFPSQIELPMLVLIDMRLARNVKQLSNIADSCSPSKKFDFKRGFMESNSMTWNLKQKRER